MSQSITPNVTVVETYSSTIATPGENADVNQIFTLFKEAMTTDKAISNRVTAVEGRTTAVEGINTTQTAAIAALEAKVNDGGTLEVRVDALEAKVNDGGTLEVRVDALEALAVNDPVKRFSFSCSGNYSGSLAAGAGTSFGSTTVTVPAGKVLRIKNTRCGVESITNPGGGADGRFYVVNRSVGGVGYVTSSRDAQDAPNYLLADNSAGGTPLTVFVTAGFKNNVGATGAITVVVAGGIWVDLAVE